MGFLPHSQRYPSGMSIHFPLPQISGRRPHSVQNDEQDIKKFFKMSVHVRRLYTHMCTRIC